MKSTLSSFLKTLLLHNFDSQPQNLLPNRVIHHCLCLSAQSCGETHLSHWYAGLQGAECPVPIICPLARKLSGKTQQKNRQTKNKQTLKRRTNLKRAPKIADPQQHLHRQQTPGKRIFWFIFG